MKIIRHIKTRGFTLIEIVVAMAIFAVISIVAIHGIRQLIDAHDADREKAEQLRQLQIAYSLVQDDFAQLLNRPIRNEDGALSAGFLGENQDKPTLDAIPRRLLAFTRIGNPNPGYREQRSSLLRVRYLYQQNQLIREVWPVLDRLPETKSWKKILLNDISQLSIHFYDASGGEHDSWFLEHRQLQLDSSDGYEKFMRLPVAITIEFEYEGESMVWQFLMPGGRRLG